MFRFLMTLMANPGVFLLFTLGTSALIFLIYGFYLRKNANTYLDSKDAEWKWTEKKRRTKD